MTEQEKAQPDIRYVEEVIHISSPQQEVQR